MAVVSAYYIAFACVINNGIRFINHDNNPEKRWKTNKIFVN